MSNTKSEFRLQVCFTSKRIPKPDNHYLIYIFYKRRPDPIHEGHETERKVELPEDKLKAGMKERLVASLVTAHEATENRYAESRYHRSHDLRPMLKTIGL